MTLRSNAYRGTLLSLSIAFAGIAFFAHSGSLMAQTPAGLSQSNVPILSSGQQLSAGNIQNLHGRSLIGTPPALRPVVVLRFAVQSNPQASLRSPSNDACPRRNSGDHPKLDVPDRELLTVDPLLLDKLFTAMTEKLSKKTDVTLSAAPETIPLGALIISGCVTRAQAGNSAKRLVGLNYGASRLEAHIVVLSNDSTGLHSEDSFDVRVKGGDLLPPLGPIGLGVHAVQDTRQNLSADAKRMADKVVKRLAKDKKNNRHLEEGFAGL